MQSRRCTATHTPHTARTHAHASHPHTREPCTRTRAHPPRTSTLTSTTAASALASSTQAAAGGGTTLPDPYKPKEEGGKLDFELRLFNALRDECERDGLGVRTSERSSCNDLLLAARDALWLMAGREVDFKCSRVRLAACCPPPPPPPRDSPFSRVTSRPLSRVRRCRCAF
jgi:hypothetical protein